MPALVWYGFEAYMPAAAGGQSYNNLFNNNMHV